MQADAETELVRMSNQMIWTWRDGFLWFATNGIIEATGWSEHAAIVSLSEKIKGTKK